MLRIKKTIFAFALILLSIFISIGLVGCSDRDVNKDIRIGYLAIAGALPTFVADESGYFAEVGLEVELVQFNSSNEIAIAAMAGRIDVIAIGATNAVIDASNNSNQRVEAFLLNGYTKSSENEKATDYLLVREGLTVDDLKGRTVAFFPGSISTVFANIILPKYGLSVDDINYVEMAPPNWLSAFESGTIDAVTAIEPFAQQIIQSGAAEVLIDGYYAEAMSNVPLSAAWFVSGRLDKATEQKIVDVYVKALEQIDSNREESLSAFSAFTRIDPSLFTEIGLNKWTLVNSEADATSLNEFIDILVESGEVDKPMVPYAWSQ